MKSAYELAMERLSKAAPAAKLSPQQKEQIAELESKYKAKIAERELLVQSERVKAIDKGDFESIEQLEKQRQEHLPQRQTVRIAVGRQDLHRT